MTRVLLLLAIAFLIVGVVTLGVGIFQDHLAWVFVSIFCEVVTGIILLVMYRLGSRAALTARTAAPAISLSDEIAPVSTAPAHIASREAEEKVPVGVGARADETAVSGRASAAAAPSAFAPATEEDEDFPIAEYDELRVAEVLPLLAELDDSELQAVREREESGKARATILGRIDELEGQGPTTAEVPMVVSAAPRAAGGFPIPSYANLKVLEVLPMIRRLDADELETVAAYEESHGNRQTILNLIDSRLDTLYGGDGAPTSVKQAAPAKKAPAKQAGAAPAKKAAPATKKAAAAPVRTAAPAKKAPPPSVKKVAPVAKKAAPVAAKKAAPVAKRAAQAPVAAKKAAPAKKAPAKKAPAKKAPAKKAPAKKAR